ncbi:porin [Stappia sp. GBMRC 2046]|uniref:Porin n=1 Tax=Stappia sediminis TaxID=2692190 RepID=A0A7X3LY63_9HYPH|nr:porin [Stappia sediminis]MXN67267.1 porin [Stappia sediminis]
MKIKSILLGASAAALAATGAQAADLPVAPEPVDYVRICDAFGTGFFYIPGTETCLRIGGRIRTEVRFNDFGDSGNHDLSAWDQDSDVGVAFRARGYARFDSRTNTEYGLLRTYLEMYWTNTTSGATPAGDSTTIDKAFIQFGGLTAGRAASFYDFYTGDAWGSVFNQGFADNGSVNLFGYTFAFGNGFSVSASVEDGTDRRAGILYPSLATVATTGGGTAPATSGNAVWPASTLTYVTTGGVTYPVNVTNGYGGHRMPDFVANLRVDQGWGSAQIMGALHQVYTDNAIVGFGVDDELGWAIGAGVTINLPMLAPGDSFSFQGSYSDGAANYAAAGNGIYADAVVNPFTGDLKKTKAWAIGAGFTHYWVPEFSTSLSASYLDYDHGYFIPDLSEWNVQGNLVWHPVAGLDIGAELEYSNQDYSSGAGDKDAISAIIRVQRTF